MQGGKATPGIGPQQIQGSRRHIIALQHPLGIRDASRGNRLGTVDHISSIGRELNAIDHLSIGGPWFGKLAGDTAQLDDRFTAGIGQDHGHLQQHLEGLSDLGGRHLRKIFRAIATLQEKGLPDHRLGQHGL